MSGFTVVHPCLPLAGAAVASECMPQEALAVTGVALGAWFAVATGLLISGIVTLGIKKYRMRSAA